MLFRSFFQDSGVTTLINTTFTNNTADVDANNSGNGALIAGGVAIVAGILSATTTPAADIRMWESLPRYLSFAALELPPGQHELWVDFLDPSGNAVVTKKATFTVLPNSTKDTVLFISEHNS